jgi:uncharacterized paraquat-inducible protein A
MMFENSYSILDLLGWLFVGIAIGACVLYFALWAYAAKRASGLTKRAAGFADCHACRISYPNTATRCTKCGGKLQIR